MECILKCKFIFTNKIFELHRFGFEHESNIINVLFAIVQGP